MVTVYLTMLDAHTTLLSLQTLSSDTNSTSAHSIATPHLIKHMTTGTHAVNISKYSTNSKITANHNFKNKKLISDLQ